MPSTDNPGRLTPWWRRYPDRWQRERAALRAAGWDYRLTRPQGLERGLRVIYPNPGFGVVDQGSRPPDGSLREIRLQVVYPSTYPFFPPRVYDPDGTVAPYRHRNPVTGELCLLDGADWDLSWTVVDLLRHQLPVLAAANEEAEESAPIRDGTEVDACAPPLGLQAFDPEPVSLFTGLQGHPTILVDGSWRIPAPVTQGALVAHLGRVDGESGLDVGCLGTIEAAGLPAQHLPAEITDRYRLTVPGHWIRFTGYRPGMSPTDLWERAATELPARDEPESLDPDPADVRPSVQVLALLVPSAVGGTGPQEEWLVLLRHRTPADEWQTLLRLTQNAGRADMTSRLPHHSALAARRVLLAGCGAVGGGIAVELARAGLGGLDLVDTDVTSPETACRQFAPLAHAGLPKSLILGYLAIGANNPYTGTRCFCYAIGDREQTLRTERLVGASDLIIDATADPSCSRYLAALARAAGKPFLHASATDGGHGGVVVLLVPDGACWGCLEHHRADHHLPVPPHDARTAEDATTAWTGTAPNVGCSPSPYLGTGADLGHVALHAARIAIDTLGDGTPESEPTGSLAPWIGVHTLRLRDRHGHPQAAVWTRTALTVHGACPLHRRQAEPAPTAPQAPDGAR